MGSKFDLPPDAHVREREEIVMQRQTIEEWDKKQSRSSRLALGLDADKRLWIAERRGAQVEIRQPGGAGLRTLEAALTDSERPELSQPRMVGGDLLVGAPDGLRFADETVLAGRFEVYDGARVGDSVALIASGEPEGREAGTWWLYRSGPGPWHVERLGNAASGVSAYHSPERIGLAWADGKGVHTAAFLVGQHADLRSTLISYYSSDTDLYTSPSVVVDQTGKAYALFYVFKREGDAWVPTRDMQLNFEKIAFRASATEDGHQPINIIHRKRIYMVYGLKPDSTTARWRVPGTTMWDGAEHIPGGWPQAVSDGTNLYVATNKGLWSMGTGQTDEGLDLISQSWASPEGDVGPRNTFGAKLKRWFGF